MDVGGLLTAGKYADELMKLKYATFRMTHGGKEYQIHFQDNNVRVVNQELQAVDFDNTNSKWRPCVTHASDLIRLAFREPIRSTFSKQRAKKTKPALRVVGKD